MGLGLGWAGRGLGLAGRGLGTVCNALFPFFDDRLGGRDGGRIDDARKGRAAHRELHAGSVLRGRRPLDEGWQDLARRLLVARQVPTEARQSLERQRRVGVGDLIPVRSSPSVCPRPFVPYGGQ